MKQSQETTTSTVIRQKVTPKMIVSLRLLNMSASQLFEAIADECKENPALELSEVSCCDRCGAPIARYTACPNCGYSYYRANETQSRYTQTETIDAIPLLPSQETLKEYLLQTLLLTIDTTDAPIGEALIGNLDEHGYLSASIPNIAEEIGTDPQHVQAVLEKLQTLEPAGVGAQTVQECLLLQARWLIAQGHGHPLIEELLQNYIHMLQPRFAPEIAKRLHAKVTDVAEAIYFIQRHLTPYPALANFDAFSQPEPCLRMKPDISFRSNDDGVSAEVIERSRIRLKLEQSYKKLLTQCDTCTVNESKQEHILKYARRTKFFIDCIKQRWETLQTIATYIATEQREFMETGVRALKPMTRTSIAHAVGVDESTVSRAINGKFIMLPNGDIHPFEIFFDNSQSVKDHILEIVQSENQLHPMSDAEIVKRLRQRGIFIQRRTITKYRMELQIGSSRERRNLFPELAKK